MQEAVRLCKRHKVKMGAHPGLPDVAGFGRREMELSGEEHTANTRYQISALRGFLEAEGAGPLHHVKPHGALYGMMCRDAGVCRAVMAGYPGRDEVPGLKVLGLAGTFHEAVARELGLEFVAELYGDVRYGADGGLVIERRKGGWDAEEVRRHVRGQIEESRVVAVTGEVVRLPTGGYPVSVCCHSDSPGAVEIVRATREVVDEFNRANGFA